MNIFQAFVTGIKRAMSEWKMVLLLYGINLLISIPLALAFRSVLGAGLGQSMDSSHLMQGLDFSVVQDFLSQHRDAMGAIIQQVIWVLLASMLVNTFLAGGILTVVRDKKGTFSASAFFGGCGTYFLRFMRLFFIVGVVLALVLTIVGGILGGIVESVLDNASSELTEYWARGASLVLLLASAMLVIMVADYAKILTVVQDERSMVRTTWRSARLVFRYFLRTVGLELLMLLVPIALFAVYLWLDLAIGMATEMTILVMFVLQQLFIISRAWARVFFFAGELSLYYSLQPFGSQASLPSPGAQNAAG